MSKVNKASLISLSMGFFLMLYAMFKATFLPVAYSYENWQTMRENYFILMAFGELVCLFSVAVIFINNRSQK